MITRMTKHKPMAMKIKWNPDRRIRSKHSLAKKKSLAKNKRRKTEHKVRDDILLDELLAVLKSKTNTSVYADEIFVQTIAASS